MESLADNSLLGSFLSQVRNPPRPGKKLLVLDIDYTIFDHRSPAETAAELRRPHLHEFLASVYPWSRRAAVFG